MRYYLSIKETEFEEFAKNFRNNIDNIAAQLNLDADKVAEVKTALEQYDNDLKTQINAKTAYKVAVVKKDASKKKAKSSIQKIVRKMRSNNSALDSHFSVLKLPIHDEILSRSKTPDGAPFLTVEIRAHCIHRLEIRNGENMARAKPETATGAEIWVFIGDSKDLNEKDLRYVGTATRSKFKVEHEPEDIGKTAHYMARWINRRGIRGHWSERRSATIAE